MRIVGIDVGTTSVKALEIESAFGRYEIHEYHEERIMAGADPMTAVQALLASLPKRPDRLVIALSSGQITFRNLSLPTRDRKSIQASVGFELEDDLPFAADQAVFDHAILGQVGQGSLVHVAATLKRYIETTLVRWNAIGADPDIITSEAWAYRTLMNRALKGAPTAEGAPVLLAQLGHQKTTLYVHHHGQPTVAREIQWGGRDLTAAISRKYGVSLEQAEQAKLDHGFVLTEAQSAQATPEQLDFSQVISEAIQPLLQEIRQAEFTCKNLTKSAFSAIYLSGGTSLLPGLHRKIEEELQISTYPMKSLSAAADSGVTYSEQTDAAFGLAAGLALSLVGPDRNILINLRKGSFAKQNRGREFNMANLKRPLISAAAVLLAMSASVTVQKQSYRKQLESLDTQLERGVKTFFGQLSSSAVKTYTSNPSTLRKSISKELDKHREQAKLMGPNPHAPIAFLREVSKTIPKEVVVDLMKFQVGAAPTAPYAANDTGTASLTFHLASQQSADRLAQLLDPKMPGAKKSEVQEVTLADGSKRWKVTFTGKPSEDAYGKQ